MKLAIGVILSPGYKAETDFLFGRPGQSGEGLLAIQGAVQTGLVNRDIIDADDKITETRVIVSRKFPTDVARNEICAGALEFGYDALLFLDADMVHPISMVAALINHRKPVVTARYHLKKPPFNAVVYVKHPTQAGAHRYSTVHFGKGLVEIERGGAGALLIRSEVLQSIKDRHIARQAAVFDVPEWAKAYLPNSETVEWFRYQYGPDATSHATTSEDFWFFRQAREAGFSCWCDYDIDVPHLGTQPIDGSWNVPFLNTTMAEYANPDMRATVLSNTVVLGYKDGMVLDDGAAVIPEYVVTAGER